MRPLVVAWLLRHGLPGALAPDYFVLVSLGTLAGMALALRLARRDGAPLSDEIRTMMLVYLAALAGGYLFEAARALPAAVALRSLRPILVAGRAAYGGLLGAIAAVWLSLRRCAAVAAFLDRAAVGTGLVFAAVRTGCFLAGCDYGVPTASPLGVRFPPGSLAALDHAARGFVPDGAASLPVHPTELYEALLGLLGAAVAALVLRRQQRRDGSAFRAWLAIYAAGRFAIEALRGDAGRGSLGGLSTAQHVSLVLLTILIIMHARSDMRLPLFGSSGDRAARRAHAGSAEPTAR
jgi:prolipoprotein diacylglyceryltransferase